MAKHIKVYWKRAVVLSSLGALCGGDLLAQSSLGLLQTPKIIELPVSIQPTGRLPSTLPSNCVYATKHKHTGELTLILTSETYSIFKQAEPVEVIEATQLPQRVRFDTEGYLRLLSNSSVNTRTMQEEDDEEVLILLSLMLSNMDSE
nr:hypothetical protein 10 [Gammaproteobacteria bacterium]